MADGTSGPALPWAAPDQPRKDEDGDEVLEGALLALDALELKLGDRIEVKWVVDTDDGEHVCRWWPATLQEAASDVPDTWKPAYVIKYDPHGEFTEECGTVAFVGAHELALVPEGGEGDGTGEVMVWRREGSTWEEEEEEDPEGEVTLTAEEHYRRMGSTDPLGAIEAELLDNPDNMLTEAGRSMVANMDAGQKAEVADRMRDFMGNFKAFIEAKGQGVITKDMVDEFAAQMRTASKCRRP